jgi:hypothetical protein
MSHAGLPNHSRSRGTSRVTTDPMPIIAQGPMVIDSRRLDPLPI